MPSNNLYMQYIYMNISPKAVNEDKHFVSIIYHKIEMGRLLQNTVPTVEKYYSITGIINKS